MGSGNSNLNIRIQDIESYYEALKGLDIPKTEHRGITINQLQLLAVEIKVRCVKENWTDYNGQPLTPEKTNLYTVAEKIIRPRTNLKNCSFVELVAKEGKSQTPKWFVSHWWGEPVMSMIKCLMAHANDRGLSHDTPYWICAYANNQWALGGEISADPAMSSFRKAMRICEGTVSILDDNCEVFKRIWCLYELFVSVKESSDADYMLDIYTEWFYEIIFDAGTSNGCDTYDAIGICDRNEKFKLRSWCRQESDANFPFDRMLKSLDLDVTKSFASRDEDLQHIKNAITGQSLESIPPDSHKAYDDLNNFLRGKFLDGRLRQIIKKTKDINCSKYLNILKKSSIKELTFKFPSMSLVTPIIESIPSSICELVLDFEDISSVSENQDFYLSLFSFQPNSLPHLENIWFEMLNFVDIYDFGKVFNAYLLFLSNRELKSLKVLGFTGPRSNLNRLDINNYAKPFLNVIKQYNNLTDIKFWHVFNKEANDFLKVEVDKIKKITAIVFV